MTRSERAKELFLQGYNCSQSVVLAFSDILPVCEDDLARMSSSFGGGMGRLREVCGAVSGMLMVAGLLYGYPGPETGEVKASHYSRVQELALTFEKEKGSLICRDLLGLSTKRDKPVPSARTADFYTSRPCGELIAYAAGLMDRYITENPPQERRKHNTQED